MGTTADTSHGLIGTVAHFSTEALRLVDNPEFELLLKTYGYLLHIQLLSAYNIDSGSIIILDSTFHASSSYLRISMRKLPGSICMTRVGTCRQN